MRQETISLYQFDELKKEVQEKVIERHRHINVEACGWDDGVLDGWYSRLQDLGFDDVKILYSGFGSQGDGACFTAKVNIERYLSAHKLKTRFKRLIEFSDCIPISIGHSWRYYFATSTHINIDFFENDPKVEGLLKEFEELLAKEREALGNAIYKDLDDDYSAWISDESVAETLKINEHEFLEDGREI